MTDLRLDSAARAEFLHEVQYYEATRTGTGRRFREAVAAVFERIERTPAAGKPDEAGCRRMRVPGFPFSVVYRVERDETVVYALRPDARKPGYWIKRAR
ncbi:MAG: type II toxin-antitoxin system RelE/ParE family toxin [Lautropia sp.]